MNIEFYEKLPEGISSKGMSLVYDKFFNELNTFNYDDIVEILYILCDKQWHTYDVPEPLIQSSFAEWIKRNWRNDDEYLDLVKQICYSFGLESKLYERAIKECHCQADPEDIEILVHSVNGHVDPYWSLRKKN